MKNIILTMLMSLITILTACSSKKILPIPPSSTPLTVVSSVTGALSSNIEVVNGHYKLELELKKDEYSQTLDATLNLKIKVNSPIDIPSGMDFGPELTPIFLDQNGAPVDLFSANLFSENRFENLASSLKNVGEIWIKFYTMVGYYSGKITDANIEEVNKIVTKLNEVKQVSLTSIVTNPKGSSNHENSSSIEKGRSSQSGTDCDQFLKEYEKFVTDYIDIIKKYKKNPTDNSILSDYTKMVTKANEWTSKIQDCQNDPKFATKYVELIERINKVVSETK